MKIDDLSVEDINILIEAVGAWDRHSTPRGAGEAMAAAVMRMATPPGTSVSNPATEMVARLQALKDQQRDTAIMLRAKLLLIRDGIEKQPPQEERAH